MSYDHILFINAITGTKMLELTFTSKESGVITRKVAPMDFGPWRRTPGSSSLRYHVIDVDSASGLHPLSILPEQIVSIKALAETFDPATFIHWTPAWHIARDWGHYS